MEEIRNLLSQGLKVAKSFSVFIFKKPFLVIIFNNTAPYFKKVGRLFVGENSKPELKIVLGMMTLTSLISATVFLGVSLMKPLMKGNKIPLMKGNKTPSTPSGKTPDGNMAAAASNAESIVAQTAPVAPNAESEILSIENPVIEKEYANEFFAEKQLVIIRYARDKLLIAESEAFLEVLEGGFIIDSIKNILVFKKLVFELSFNSDKSAIHFKNKYGKELILNSSSEIIISFGTDGTLEYELRSIQEGEDAKKFNWSSEEVDCHEIKIKKISASGNLVNSARSPASI